MRSRRVGTSFFIGDNLDKGVAVKIGEGGSGLGWSPLEKDRNSNLVGCQRQGCWRKVFSINVAGLN